MQRFGQIGLLAVLALLLAISTIVGLLLYEGTGTRTGDAGSAPALAPEADQALDQGIAAFNQKAFTVAIDYFRLARRAAPLAPAPLYYLGLAEAQIRGRELRAICWFEAFLALTPRHAKAPEVRQIILVLEVRARKKLDEVHGLLNKLADTMDHEGYRKEQTSSLQALARWRNALPSAPISPPSPSFSEPVARWQAQAWIDLVEKRMNIPSFLDSKRALETAEAGHRLESHYPDPYPYMDPMIPAFGQMPTPAQNRLGGIFSSVRLMAQDILAGSNDVLNKRLILTRLERQLAGLSVKSIFGPWPCAGPFSEGMAAVSESIAVGVASTWPDTCGGGWGFIDKAGTLVISREHSNGWAVSPPPPRFSEGLASFGSYFIDRSGGVVVQGERPGGYSFCDARDFHEGMALASGHCSQGSTRKWGFINTTGTLAIPFVWGIDGRSPPLVGNFSEGLALVWRGGKSGFIDKRGQIEIPLEWDGAGPFSDGLAAVGSAGKRGFINKKGTIAIPLEWGGDKPFSEGLAAVERAGKWGFIDKTRQIVVRPEWEEVKSFSEGLAAVRRGEKLGFIDKTGKVVIPLELEWHYGDFSSFSEGLARVGQGGQWRLINKDGKIVTPDAFPNVLAYSEGMVMIEISETYRGGVYPAKAFVEIAW